MRALAISLAVLVAYPAPVMACSIRDYAESGLNIDTRNLAYDMLAAATTVDLVEVERTLPIDPAAFLAAERAQALGDARPEWVASVNSDFDDYEDSYRRWGASTITFRVLERLKGPLPPSSFELTGFYVRPTDEFYPMLTPQDLGEPRASFPTGEDVYARHLVELKDWGGSGSCSAPLTVVEGVRYLIFRGADGGLLYDGAPRFSGPPMEVAPGVYGLVAEPASEGDPWLNAVRTAAAR